MRKPFTSGAGGGSGPKNSRDSLFSGDAVEVVLGISEGPIEGIKGTTIEEKLQNVFLDGTPVLTLSGDKSFEDSQVVINFEPGTAVTEMDDAAYGQTPIPYMLGGTATPVSVSSTLDQDVSITRTVPSAYRNKYNKIEVRIMVSQLANMTKDGARELSVRVKIESKPSASSTWTANIHTISGKTLGGGFVRSFAFFVADSSVDMDLRVTMLDANDPETTVRQLFWLNYELSESLNKDGQIRKEYHPGTAMMTFVSKIGENFNRIPGLTAVWRGLLCKVPSNYDPVTRLYNEVVPWDGTFKAARVWTNNPFWLVRELITNPRFGMARYNPRVTVDDYSLYEEAKYADTLRTVDGKTIPLFTFNGVIRDPMLGLELINFILGSANAQAIEYASGYLKIVSDRNVPAIMDVTPEMCVQQESGITFNYSASALKDRPNEVQATYIEPNLDWQEQFVGPFKDEEAQNTQGVNLYEFKALGCTNIYEATYKAFYRLISAQTEVLTCTFTIPLMAISWEIYDIINIVDPDMDWGMSGRARSISGTLVTLRDPLYFEATGTYTFVLQTLNGSTVQHSFNVAAVGSYTSLTLTAPVTATLSEYPAFSVQKVGAAPGVSKPFRIVAISRVDGAPHLRGVTCVEVNRNKWQQALDGVLGEKPRYNFEQPRMPNGPTNLSYIGETSLVIKGELRPLIRLQWDAEPYSFLGLSYAVYVSENGNPFYEAAVTRTNYYEFPVLRDIVYQFYIQLRYQDIKLNSNLLDWQSYRLRPADIVEANLGLSVTQEFNYLSMKLKLAATYLIPGTDQTLDLFGSNEIEGFTFELVGKVVPPSGPSYPITILTNTQTSPEIILEGDAILSALNTANGGWSLRVRLISRDSEALLNELPFKWASTPAGSGGYLWRKSRQYTANGVAVGDWENLQNLTLGREIQFSANGSSWVAGYLPTHKFYRTRTVTNNGTGNVYGTWSAGVNFVDYSTSATHSRYIFVYSAVTPPNYNEFPWQSREISVSKPEFPTVLGMTLISSSRTISGEISTSGGTVPADVEWWVADSSKVPDTQQPRDAEGKYPLKVVMNPRKMAHTGASMYGKYVAIPEMDCQVWVRFKYAGYYSGFWPADAINPGTGQLEAAPGQAIKTQKASFDELGLNLEKTVFVYRRAAEAPGTPSKAEGTFLAPVPAGWSLTSSSGTDPEWMTSRVYYLDGTSTEWNPVTGSSQSLLVQYSPDGENDWATIFRETDVFMRQSTDSGVTWSLAIRIVGEKGSDGKFTDFRFRRSPTAPAQPANVDSPTDWFDSPPAGADALWMIRGSKDGLGKLQGTWSNVIRLSGEDGTYVEFRYLRSDTPPSTPMGVNPSGWFLSTPAGTSAVWMTQATKKLNGSLVGGWSTPTKISGENAPALLVQYSVDGNSWHNTFQVFDIYMRQSTNNGVSWSAAIRIVGEDGDRGVDGKYTDYRFMRSPTPPGTPTGPTPAGWSDAPPTGTDPLYMTSAQKNADGSLIGGWSTPTRISGENAAPLLVQYSANGTTWANTFQAGHLFMRQSTNNGASWSAAIRIVGENGAPGVDGKYMDYRFMRSPTPPGTPTGPTPAGWSDAPPAGTAPLYMISAQKNADGSLVSGWSAPIKLTGDDGAVGRRGTVHVYVLVASAAWSDSLADAALSSAPHNGKIVADRVTLSFPAGKWSETRTWTGSAWTTVAEVIDGNLLVTGSITADKININSLFATDANISGSLMVGNSSHYVKLGGNYFIEAVSGTNPLFVVGNGEGFVDGEFLRGGSVKQKHMDQSVLTWIRNELGAGNPEFGGLRTLSAPFSSNTFALDSFNSNGSSISFNYNYSGRGIMHASVSLPSTPLIEVTIRRGSTVVATNSYSGSVHLDEPGRYAMQLPMIDWSPSESSPPAGPLAYSVQIMVYNWPVAFQGSHNFRSYQVPSGSSSTSVDWANVSNKPVMTDAEVTAGTGTVGKLATATQLRLAVNTFNSATATALQNARTINGVSFNGTANITIEDNTKLSLTGGTINSVGDTSVTFNKTSGTSWNYITFSVQGSRKGYFGVDGSGNPIWGTDTGTLGIMGTLNNNGHQVLNASNFNAYSPTLVGAGASGTWGINISGKAATATKLATAVSITSNGDVIWGVNFDGSQTVSSAANLSQLHASSGVVGSASQIPQINYDSKGRVTGANNVTPSGTWGISITGNAATSRFLTGPGLGAADPVSNGLMVTGTGGAAQLYLQSGSTWVGGTSSYIDFYAGGSALAFFTSGSLQMYHNTTISGTLTATDCISTSDERVKYNLTPMRGALSAVSRLRGMLFNRKDQQNRRCAGVIAQDVLAVLPEGVYTDAGGKLHVSNMAVTGLTIEAIKELELRLRRLENLLSSGGR